MSILRRFSVSIVFTNVIFCREGESLSFTFSNPTRYDWQMLRIQFLLSVACVLILVTEVNAAGPDQNDLVIPAYCRNFRLDQVPEAARLREELIEKALVSKDWDKERGKNIS